MRQLIVAEKQLVEIAKALARKARLLIMDEPTATLDAGRDASALFALMAQLKAEGVTIVYISHKLDEVERVTDEVIVMRDGRFVARAADRHADAPPDGQADGGPRARPTCSRRRIRRPWPARRRCSRSKGLSVPGWAEDVSFEVRPGEILGFAGLVGAGRTELFEGLLGLRPHRVQRVEVDGRAVRLRYAARRGRRTGSPT